MLDWTLFILVALLQILDFITTILALKRPNVREGNPIVARLMEICGVVPALLLSKAFVIGSLLLSILYFPSLYLTAAMAGTAMFYVYVVVTNYRNL